MPRTKPIMAFVTRAALAGVLGAATASAQGLQTGTLGGTHLFDLALTYQIPIWRTVRPYIELEVFNLFNDDSLIDFNTTVTPDFDGPGGRARVAADLHPRPTLRRGDR